MAKKTAYILGVLLVAATVTCVVLWLEVRNLRDELAAATASQRALNKKLWSAQGKISELQRTAVVKQVSAAADPMANPMLQAKSVSDILNSWVDLLNKPETTQLLAEQQRAMVNSRYSALFSELKLSPDKAKRLRDLLVEKEVAYADVAGTCLKNGVNPVADIQTFNQLLSSAQAGVDETISKELGDKDYKKYAEFSQSELRRAVVGELSSALGPTAPLSEDQNRRLAQTLANTGPDAADRGKLGQSGTPPVPNPYGIITDQTIAEAKTYLSADQQEVLKEHQRAQHAKYRLQQMMQGQ